MPRPANHSSSLFAQVRAYFGLTQHQLAEFLGVPGSQVSHLEAGRRRPSLALLDALAPLTQQMPDEPAPAPAVPEGQLAAGPLQERLRYCRWRATNLRYEMLPLEARAAVAARWARALPALLAPLPKADALAPPVLDATPAGQAAYRQWFQRCWLDTRPTALDPEALAQWHLLRLRAEALETEAAALEKLLAPAPK
ncbi:helix-turn-helix domain-containing protein [Hymenobacter chitinivorans]|uniref:Helix-turn-helix protein n=1 Tax=Hymenobacter chitinivorans DSM 11115 TaxID=1121954 RepID=A0A2M9B4Z5_9BACT|nr:helix-turn-helix transcriptional regulator [Hymenobacter chitinivorans]PJJ53028.1 helix-turn-helix protein [Hymenobacter chitinivorans DSM 11115]